MKYDRRMLNCWVVPLKDFNAGFSGTKYPEFGIAVIMFPESTNLKHDPNGAVQRMYPTGWFTRFPWSFAHGHGR